MTLRNKKKMQQNTHTQSEKKNKQKNNEKIIGFMCAGSLLVVAAFFNVCHKLCS